MADELLLRQTPHSVEAEQAVLGSILLDPSCTASVMEALSEGDFYIETNKIIFRTIAHMFTNVDKAEVKKRLMQLYTIPVAPYKTLLDSNNPGAGWFSANNYAKQKEIEWGFWYRYQKFLRENEKYQPGVIFQLDRLTNEILDNLYDPTLTNTNFSKKSKMNS